MKLSELKFCSDEASRILLKDDDKPTGGISFRGETLADFMEEIWQENAYDHNAAEINKTLKQCGIQPLKIQLNFKDEVGMCFRVNNEWFIRKGYGGINEGGYYKSAVFTNYRPIYQAEFQEDDYYTSDDLIELCDGNAKRAELLWKELDWQFPETLLEDWDVHDINVEE